MPDVYIDNIFFYQDESTVANEPTTPAPTPTHATDKVVSIYSDAYENVPVATWSADWDMADVSDTQVAGNPVKKYTLNGFSGIELASPFADAGNMSHFHLDVWVPEQITGNLNIKLVDFGPDGVYGGGDDVEHELTLPEITPGEWNSIDIPLSDFTNLVTRNHVAQVLLIGNVPTLYLDNLYMYSDN